MTEVSKWKIDYNETKLDNKKGGSNVTRKTMGI